MAVALVRGLVRRSSATIGNFWVDLVRLTLYVLLPLSFVFAILLVSQGSIQTLSGPTTATTITGAQQTIALGPIASQEAIKELGTNGGGPFNANSAHPFENPNALTDWFEIFFILLIPFGLTATFGKMAGDRRQGWALFATMMIVLVAFGAIAVVAEARANPLFPAGIDQALGNMEGKEVRFGTGLSAIFATATTATSTGAVNSMHASFTPLGGLVPLTLIMLGEVVPGGTGSGLYGLLVFAILAVFIAGLMVGRTPEYLGKKIEAYEMKMANLFVLVAAFSILVFTAIGVSTSEGLAGTRHGRSAWLQRDPVRLHQPDRQQRLGLRQPVGQHALLQHQRRGGHAHRSLRDDDPGAGHRRLDGRQAPRCAFAGHLPDHRSDLRRAAHRHGDHRRRAHLLPGAGPWAHRRRVAAPGRKVLLT